MQTSNQKRGGGAKLWGYIPQINNKHVVTHLSQEIGIPQKQNHNYNSKSVYRTRSLYKLKAGLCLRSSELFSSVRPNAVTQAITDIAFPVPVDV